MDGILSSFLENELLEQERNHQLKSKFSYLLTQLPRIKGDLLQIIKSLYGKIWVRVLGIRHVSGIRYQTYVTLSGIRYTYQAYVTKRKQLIFCFLEMK